MVAQLEEYNLNSPACKDCEDLNALMQISNLISITGDLNTVLKKSIEQINGIMGVTTGGVLLYDTKINRLVLQRPAFDMDNEKFMGYSREVINEEKPGMGASVKVFITGQPHISNYPLNDTIIRQEIVNCYNIRTSLTVPLVINKKCLGALHLINAHKGYFSQVDARRASLFASHLAVVINNARTFAQMEAQNRLLLRTTEIYNQLTKMVLYGNSLEAITKTLSRLLGRSIQVEDQYLKPLAYGRPPNAEQSAAPGPETINGEALCNPEVQNFLRRLQKEKRALPFPNHEQYGLKTIRIMSAIQVGSETLGYVSVMAASGFLEELDFMAVECAATVYALQFMQQKVAFEVEERIRGQLLEDLVYGRIKEDEILKKAGYLGYNLHHFYYVMIIGINENDHEQDSPHRNSMELSKQPHLLVNLVGRIIGEQGFKVLTARSNPLLVLIDTGVTEQQKTVYQLAEKIHQTIDKKLKNKCTIGISRAAMGLNELRVSYKQAEKAFQIANKLKWHDVVPYESLGVFRVFMQVENQEVLKDYLYEILGPLLAYDQSKKSNLLDTLRVYADSNFNNQKTANRLFIHINTLKYRLDRIREIGKLNLDDAEERLNIQLAMKIMAMLDDVSLPQNDSET